MASNIPRGLWTTEGGDSHGTGEPSRHESARKRGQQEVQWRQDYYDLQRQEEVAGSSRQSSTDLHTSQGAQNEVPLYADHRQKPQTPLTDWVNATVEHYTQQGHNKNDILNYIWRDFFTREKKDQYNHEQGLLQEWQRQQAFHTHQNH